MRQINNKTRVILLLFTAFTLLSCEDKNYYDPEKENKNPLEMTAPSGFEWQTTRSTDVRVEVNDEFNGGFNYLIEIFDKNPVIDNSAKLITNGTAKTGHAFTTKIALPVNIEGVYIKQTTPAGLESTRYVDVTNGTIDINFGNVGGAANRSTRSTIATRATINAPEISNDLFPTAAPSGAQKVTGSWQGANGNYKLDGGTFNLSQIGNTSNIYVTENSIITAYNGRSDHKIYILPGKKLEVNISSFSFSTTGGVISIGEGSQLVMNGAFATNNKIYNKGTVSVNTAYSASNSSIFYNIGENSKLTVGTSFAVPNYVIIYNEGTIEVGGEYRTTSAEPTYNGATGTITAGTFHMESVFVNDNLLTCGDCEFTGSSNTTNNGTVIVSGLTTFNSPDQWINNGLWETLNLNTISYKAAYVNNCKLIVHEELSFAQAFFYNEAGSHVSTKTLSLTNTRVELGSESYFLVTGSASLKESGPTYNRGFWGVGEKTALLEMTKAVRGDDPGNIAIQYGGNLMIACDDHFEQTTGVTTNWIMDGTAQWASETTKTVEIPKNGECNPGSPTNPDPNPGDKDPEPIVDPFSYSYLFEDLWPFYGDYDMNDAVILVNNITKNINKEGKINSLSFDYSLKAVGAGASLGAALMLDAIEASSVSEVTYSSMVPKGFEVTGSGVETNQTRAVIPLFANAHNFLGRNPGQFVNTVKGSPSNVSDVPTVTVTITFTAPITDNLDATTFNPFIIPASGGILPSTNRKEVHMLGYIPSDRANTSLFGNNDDRSTSSNYFVSRDNLSWAIVIPDEFRWPIEYKSIKLAYTGFANWVQTGGAENKDWWKTPASEEFVY